jgi:hypothetical protein
VNTQPKPPLLPAEKVLRDLDIGCRIGFLAVTVLLALLAGRLAWLFSPTEMQAVFTSLLKGQYMPATTRIAIGADTLWLQLIGVLSLGSLLLGLNLRRPLWALIAISGCNLALVIIIIFLAISLTDPFVSIIKGLT